MDSETGDPGRRAALLSPSVRSPPVIGSDSCPENIVGTYKSVRVVQRGNECQGKGGGPERSVRPGTWCLTDANTAAHLAQRTTYTYSQVNMEVTYVSGSSLCGGASLGPRWPTLRVAAPLVPITRPLWDGDDNRRRPRLELEVRTYANRGNKSTHGSRPVKWVMIIITKSLYELYAAAETSPYLYGTRLPVKGIRGAPLPAPSSSLVTGLFHPLLTHRGQRVERTLNLASGRTCQHPQPCPAAACLPR